MGLRFIIGRSGSGKTTFCLDEIKKKQKLGKRLIYIVPEQFSLEAERELAAVCGGMISTTVLSFRRLAEIIFSEKGAASGKHLDETGKLMILRRILIDNRDKLEYFGAVCQRQGFIDRFGREITDFSKAGITPEDIEKYAEGFPENSAMRFKLKDTALIYSKYCLFLHDEYISLDDMLTVAAGKMDNVKYITGSEVWLDGFYGFSVQEYGIINRLLMSCERVNIILNIDVNEANKKKLTMENGFFEPWDTIQRLKKMCSDNGYAVEESVCLYDTHYATDGMKRLEREYFGWNINDIADSSGITLITAESMSDEINTCAAEIIHLVRDKGLRYRDIALTARNLNEYEQDVRLIFSHYGIPFFMDTKRQLKGRSYSELLCAIIEMVSNSMSYEAVFRCFKTELTDITREERDILENYVLKYGIKGDTWFNKHWQWGFENSENTEDEDRINDIKDRAVIPFADFYKKYRHGRHTIRDITTDLYGISERLEIAEKLKERAERAEGEGDINKAQEQIGCCETVNALLESLVSLMGEDEVEIDEYGDIFESGISGLKMGIIPAGVDSVTVGDIERTRLPKIRALFVVGANEGVLPSTDTEQNGIFTDREAEALENMGMELSHSASRQAFEEQYLIYMGITKSNEYLYISRAKSDGSGKETRPSSVITRLKSIFPEIKEKKSDRDSLNAIDRPIPVLHKLGHGLEKNDDLWNEALDWLVGSNEYRSRALMIKNASIIDNKEEKLADGTLEKLYRDKFYTSVSQLETYVKCPFCYFSKYSLGIKPRSVFEIRTPDLGILFHSVLEKFTQDMKERKLTWQTVTESEISQMISDAVDSFALDENSRVFLSTSAYKYLIKRVKRITNRAVNVLKKHMDNNRFITLGSEIGFGMGNLPPIDISMPDGKKILLRGKIDRVDIYRKEGNGYIKIIDYKSGNKEFSLSDVYYGLQLQLLLYMDAFIKNGKAVIDAEPQVGGAFYFKIADPVIRESELKGGSPEEALYKKFCMTGLACNESDVLEALDAAIATESKSSIINISKNKNGEITGSAVDKYRYGRLMDYVSDKAKDIGCEITEGNIAIKPVSTSKSSPCDYCEYKSFCRHEKNTKDKRLKYLAPEEVWDRILTDD